MQTALNNIKITIVDDCSTECTYDDVVERYKGVTDIRCFRMDANGGPGVARQYGIDHTQNEYMLFIDADDTLYNAFAVETLLSSLEKHNDACAVFGAFIEESIDGFQVRSEDVTWMHGKMYRRSFWEKYNIRFHQTSRANEDNGVNAIVRLLSKEYGYKIVFSEDIVYCWHYQPHSITRNNDHDYYFTSSYSGFVENMIYAMNSAISIIGEPSRSVCIFAARVMCFLYAYWCETVQYRPDYADVNYEHCRLFYNMAYKGVASQIPYDEFSLIYTSAMCASFQRFPTYIPTKTLYQVIDDFKIKKGLQNVI